MKMAEAPKIPTPDTIMATTNKHIAQTMELLNAQISEASAALGAPAPPSLPKFAPPSLPKMGSSSPFPAFPQLPFMAPPTKKGEETIVKAEIPTPTKAKILV